MGRDLVLTKAWQNAKFRGLRRSAQALFAQLVTQGAPNIAGVLPLMPAKWAAGCDEISEASVMADLSELCSAGMVAVDPASFEVLIRGYIRDSGAARHASQLVGACKCAKAVESVLLRTALAKELQVIGSPEGLAAAEILAPAEEVDRSLLRGGSNQGGSYLGGESEVGSS